MTHPRFFLPAAQVQANRAVLTGSEFHHLRHVVRLTTGDCLILCDERGRQHQGTIAGLSTDRAEITITASTSLPTSRCPLTLAQGLLKGHKMDLVIEKATELGVHAIVPFFSTFTVAHLPPERYPSRLERWQRIAQSAAKQSGSPPPRISLPQSLRDLLAAVPHGDGKLLLYEKERRVTLKTLFSAPPPWSGLWIVIGSEGGFADSEIDQARAAGFHIAGLGPSVVRAETASIVAVALCQFVWG